MSRLELFTPSKDQLMVESLYKIWSSVLWQALQVSVLLT